MMGASIKRPLVKDKDLPLDPLPYDTLFTPEMVDLSQDNTCLRDVYDDITTG